MLSKGNSAVQRTVLNLLRTIRGECPMVRTKGIDRTIIDSPASESYRLKQDADLVITKFEPRANLDSVNVDDLKALHGDLSVLAKID